MKINKAIVTSTENNKYLDFWPVVKKSWERLEVEPVLYIISDKTNEHSDAKYFHIPEVNPVFVSQTLRLLAPSLHKDDICIISDMDMIPLSKDYFVNKLKNYEDDKFVIFRSGATSEDMLPICWNAAKGSTWSKIFKVNNITEIIQVLTSWYPKSYEPFKDNWYLDQFILKKSIDNFELDNKSKVIRLTDEILNFKRLNRSNYRSDLKLFKQSPNLFVDFHMPRPYKLHKKSINKVLKIIENY